MAKRLGRFIIAVDGKWIGRWKDIDDKIMGFGKFYAVNTYPTLEKARSIAKRRCGHIEIMESWGVGPEQRKVVESTYNPCKKRSKRRET